jgi:PTH1 family peptidyl-tRNA hydrolase
MFSWLRRKAKPTTSNHHTEEAQIMKLWVGLGNPGAKHALDRHNIGFMVVDAIADDHKFSPEQSKFSGLIRTGTIEGVKILILKPTTFMNKSGDSVQKAMAFYKVPLADVTVFHDELDIAPGKVRVKMGGGLAGHNGLKSINQMCGGPDFQRIRLGIGHPGHKDRVSGYVLSGFAKDEINMRDDMCNGIGRYADELAKGATDLFQNRVAEYVAG